jgi:hypothetical protein
VSWGAEVKLNGEEVHFDEPIPFVEEFFKIEEPTVFVMPYVCEVCGAAACPCPGLPDVVLAEMGSLGRVALCETHWRARHRDNRDTIYRKRNA